MRTPKKRTLNLQKQPDSIKDPSHSMSWYRVPGLVLGPEFPLAHPLPSQTSIGDGTWSPMSTPQCSSIKGLIVFIRWYLGSLKG